MKKKWLLFIFIFPVALHVFSLFFLHFGENFHARDFAHGFEQSYATPVSGLTFSQLDPILSQPFHYLGLGKQMMAFESQDGKYVIKFFNPMRPLQKKWYLQWRCWKHYSSLKWMKRERTQKKIRLQKLFKRHQLAYEHFKEETGLIFVHLHPSPQVIHCLHVTDARGKKHVLSLEETPFVLQEKAVLVLPYLQQLLAQNQKEKAKQAVNNLRDLFNKRVQVGITDRIQTMENNYGFVGEKPIQIDVGRIVFDPQLSANPTAEYLRILDNLHQWLSRQFPDL